MNSETVAVAMSGGVDSSVAASLLKEQYNVIGVTMRHYDNLKYGFELDEGINAAILDAQKVAEKLEIEHFTIDLQEDFQQIVENYFVSEYKAGRTPNPCTLCNPTIKWGRLLDEAEKLGAVRIATGHFVHSDHQDGIYKLFRGSDLNKDQSYMLWGLDQNKISKTIFPVSHLSKKEVRSIAADLDLPVHDKEESQEICFIKGHYEDYLKTKLIFEPGDIKLPDGKIIGRHRGLPLYTIGQRKGLNTPWSAPLFVLQLDMTNNTLIVTDNPDDLSKRSFQLGKMNWLSGKLPDLDKNVEVQIRYNSRPVPIKSYRNVGSELEIILIEPTRAITPGQSAVFYQGNELLGGGIIL